MTNEQISPGPIGFLRDSTLFKTAASHFKFFLNFSRCKKSGRDRFLGDFGSVWAFFGGISLFLLP